MMPCALILVWLFSIFQYALASKCAHMNNIREEWSTTAAQSLLESWVCKGAVDDSLSERKDMKEASVKHISARYYSVGCVPFSVGDPNVSIHRVLVEEDRKTACTWEDRIRAWNKHRKEFF